MKIRQGWLLAFCLCVGFSWITPAHSEPLAHEFTGAKKCSMCHKKAESGDQYGIWLETKHAKAMESLGTPEAKEIAVKLGIEDPAKSGKCLKCHSTAYWFSEEKMTEAIP